MRLLFLLLFVPLFAVGQSVRHVEVECRALFPFDPLSGRYVAGSMSQVAQYADQWRAYDSLSLRISKRLMLGYRLYEALVDSTLSDRVLRYFAPFSVAEVDSSSVDFSQMPHSRKFTDRFNSDIQRIKRFYATPLCRIVDTLRARDSFYGGSAYASLFHRFQFEVSGADISLFAPVANDGDLTGEIFVADVYRMFRYDNVLVVVQMSGEQLRECLEQIFDRRYYRMRDENSDLVKWRMPAYLHTSVAGVSFRYNLTKGKIEDFSLTADAQLRVVMDSYTASKIGVEGCSLGDYRFALVRWLAQQGDVSGVVVEQWRLQPERWVERCRTEGR